mmetsp:Transcript_4981/g.16234  ORF Transcript_4981/g.16234 Transcript_4981/m.16234 type:complete len:230 (+) Transcript_4981:138-827(+)
MDTMAGSHLRYRNTWRGAPSRSLVSVTTRRQHAEVPSSRASRAVAWPAASASRARSFASSIDPSWFLLPWGCVPSTSPPRSSTKMMCGMLSRRAKPARYRCRSSQESAYLMSTRLNASLEGRHPLGMRGGVSSSFLREAMTSAAPGEGFGSGRTLYMRERVGRPRCAPRAGRALRASVESSGAARGAARELASLAAGGSSECRREQDRRLAAARTCRANGKPCVWLHVC